MKERREKLRRGERGSVTLFVLVAMLFFLIVLVLSYVGILNKKQAQIKQIEKIQREYLTAPELIENLYEEIKNNTILDLTFETNGKTYYIAKNGKVELSSFITIHTGENMTMVSGKYGWSTSNIKSPTQWNTFMEDRIQATKRDATKGEYYIWVSAKDNKGVTRQAKSGAFVVEESVITIMKSTEEYTKEPVEVTIGYGRSEERRVGKECYS